MISTRQKSIHLGRIRRWTRSSKKSFSHPAKINLNSSAFSSSTFDDQSDRREIPPAPPFPSSFNETRSTVTPSGTDLAQPMSIRPSQLSESTLRNRRRTPLTPDVLALTKLRRPQHIKSSIAQRIEELKKASTINKEPEQKTDLLITCDYQNTPNERQWLKDQTQSNPPVKFVNALPQYLQLNHRSFTIRSIEFVDSNQIRFHAKEQPTETHFFSRCVKQINLLTILILSILRLIENTLSNLAIPGIQILLNLLYIFLLIIISLILLTSQK